MKKAAIAVIHESQPYRDAQRNAPLRRLRDLSNYDKHHTLQLSVVAAHVNRFTSKSRVTAEQIGKPVAATFIRPRRVFDDSTVLATLVAPEGMEAQPVVTIEVLFDKGTGAPHRPVASVLHAIAEIVGTEIGPALYPHL